MTPEQEIMRQAAEAVDRAFAGFVTAPESGPATICGFPAYIKIDREAGTATVYLRPLTYAPMVDVEIGFEACTK